jgi:hypothetical protein
MTNHDSGPPSATIGALLASGFPFQTAVAGIVREVPNCDLVREEFPWRDIGGEDRFLDIVVTKHRFIVTIECKKTQKETLTFLQPCGIKGDITRARCVYLTQIQDSTKRMELFCSDRYVSPKSTESMFCVVSTSASGKDQRLLERDAQMLIRGTDTYARKLRSDFEAQKNPEDDRTILPAIVTNAKLSIAYYKTTQVSLESGQLPTPLPEQLQSVSWVRFRKGFSSGNKDLGDRTVFVVRAPELSEWLNKLDFAGAETPSKSGRVHFQ